MAVEKQTTFDVEGIRFEQRRLGVNAACEGADIFTAPGEMAKMAKFLRLFAPVCKVSRCADGAFAIGGNMVDLKTFANDVFEGRLEVLIAFVAKATEFEYGAFLALARGAQAAAEAPTANDPATP